jgi:hypothetical protein
MKEHYSCKTRITRVQTAGFIAYCTVTCNGSSDIAEIIRRLPETYGMDERESPEEQTYGSESDVFGLLQRGFIYGIVQFLQKMNE